MKRRKHLWRLGDAADAREEKRQGPMRGHAGSKRSDQGRLLLLDFTLGLALGGLDG